MSIVTQCPDCGTRFRVTPPQLQAQHGMVRCGRCAKVFDGFKTLATLEDSPADDTASTHFKTPRFEEAPAVAAPEPAPLERSPGNEPDASPLSAQPTDAVVVDEPAAVAAPATVEATAEDVPVVQSVAAPPEEIPASVEPVETTQALSAEQSPDFAVEAPPASESFEVTPADSTPVVAAPDDLSATAKTDETLERSVAEPVSPEPAPFKSEEIIGERLSDEMLAAQLQRPRQRSSAVWVLGVVILLIGLAAQGAYYYRSDIAANVPEARPHLNKMCELLRCVVALPQRPRQISIEASDMQATDPANPGVIALTATLRNHASTALGYPALDVVLTNTKEHTVARRIFLPSDYLPAGKDARGGIAANAEITIRLDLETGDLGAAGFRLDLIAAPPG